MKPIRCAFLLLTLTLGVFAANAQSWVSLSGPVRPHEVLDLAIGKSGSAQSVYAVDVDTMKLSTDGGRTWNPTGASNLRNSLAAACQVANPAIAVVGKVGTGTGVYRTSNGGTTWNQVGPSTTYDLVPTRIAFSPDDPNLTFLGTERTPSDEQTTLWRSTDGGQHWSAITFFQTNAATFVNDIMPHPTDDNWVYVAGSLKDYIEEPDITEEVEVVKKKGFWKSSDRGANWSWTVGDLASGNQNLTALAFSQYVNTVIFAGAFKGKTTAAKIFQTTNNGTNWTETCELAEGMTQIRAIAVNPENQQMIIAATNAGLYMTTNRGTDWDAADVPEVGMNIYDLAFDQRDADTLCIATGASVYKGLYAGGYGWSWTLMVTGSNTLDVTSFSMRSGVAYAVSSGWTGISKYSSGSWDMVSSMKKFGGHAVSINISDGAKVYAGGKLGTGGTLLQTANSGGIWSEGTSSGAGSYFSCVLADRKANSSYVWAGLDGTSVPAQPASRTTNNGVNWSGITTDHSGTAILSLAVNSSSGSSHSDTVFAGRSSYGVSRSPDAGSTGTWTNLGPNSFNITAVALNASTSSLSQTVYLGETQSVWKSTSSGANASALQNVPFSGAKKLLMHPSYANSADHLWAIPTNGQALYRTDNGGTSWTQVSTTGLQLPLNDLQSDPYNDSLVFVGTSAGIYRINPAPLALASLQSAPSGGHPGIRWNTHPESDVVKYKVYRYFRFCQYYLPNKQCGNPQDTVCVTPNGITDTTFVDAAWDLVCYGCYGSNLRIAGYFVKAVDGGGNLSPGSPSLEYTVGSDDDPQEKVAVEQLPLEYSLSMNYPNPFNPTTTIRYALPEDVHVRLTVVDILGREVGVLVDEPQTAGHKDVIFDARNISSGVYFYKLTAGNFTEVKKMVVAR